jgi:hypothetical protein
MGSEAAAAAVPVEISSDEEDDDVVRVPAASAAAGKRKSPEGALDWAERMLADEDLGGASGEAPVDPAAVQELLDCLMDATGIVMDDKDGASAVVDNRSNSARGGEGGGGGDDDDDCIILDGDPDKPVTIAKEDGPRRDAAAEDELQIVAEKGEVNCALAYCLQLLCSFGAVTVSHCRHR